MKRPRIASIARRVIVWAGMMPLVVSAACIELPSNTIVPEEPDAEVVPMGPICPGDPGCVPGPPPAGEPCNGRDDDGDGAIDEDSPAPCPRCEDVEDCDGADTDCDGVVDEGCECIPGESRPCGDEVGACRLGVSVCEPTAQWGRCQGEVAPTDEDCDGLDNDCDGRTDEALLNACDQCGLTPDEVCDDRDNDCDGQVDEGVQNACGECGAAPSEACDGRDNDCDGRVDEGLLNACELCGDPPEEICDGIDNDCDDAVDEATTGRIYALVGERRRWQCLPDGPLGPASEGDPVMSLTSGQRSVVAIGESGRWYPYLFEDDGRWAESIPNVLQRTRGADIRGVYRIPGYHLDRANDVYRVLTTEELAEYTIATGATFRFIAYTPNFDEGSWVPSGGPEPDDLVDTVLTLRSLPVGPDRALVWEGSPDEICNQGPDVIHFALGALTDTHMHVMESGYCFEFIAQIPRDQWLPFTLPGLPSLDRIRGVAYVNREPVGHPEEGYYVYVE